MAEFDAASGLPRVEYVWLDDLPIAMLRTATDSPGVYFIHSDHLSPAQGVGPTHPVEQQEVRAENRAGTTLRQVILPLKVSL